MNKKQFQQELLIYTEKRLNETDYRGRERNIQLAYQLGVVIGLLYDLADADNYNYNRIAKTLKQDPGA
jgi:hypothetical protein